MNTKNILQEIVISDSRDWLAKQGVINLIGQTSFEINDMKKLQQWRDVSVKFFQDKIKNDFGNNAIKAITLHLDETTPHIHILFNRQRLQYNNKWNKEYNTFSMTNTWWSKNNNYDRNYISNMWKENQREFWEYTQEMLFNHYGWDKSFPKQSLEQNKKNYLNLNDYKKQTRFNEILKQENKIKHSPKGNQALKNQQLNKAKNDNLDRKRSLFIKLKYAIKNNNIKDIDDIKMEFLSVGETSSFIKKLEKNIKIEIERELKEQDKHLIER